MSFVNADASVVAVDVEEGFDALSRHRHEWEQLFRSRAHEPSTSYEWTVAMARHQLRAGDRCFMLRLRRGDLLLGLVPLVHRRVTMLGRPATVLAPLSEDSNTHSDLLLAALDHETVAALINVLPQLGGGWDRFRMGRLLACNPLTPLLRQACEAAGHLQVERAGVSAYALDLPESFEHYLASRSAKFRNHLRRIERKLHEAGAVQVHDVLDTGNLEAAYDALLHVERGSWKHEQQTSIASVPVQERFYRDLASGALEHGRLCLQWLTLAGRPIAYNLGYLTSARYHYLKTSYVQDARPLSPATYLRAHLIATLIRSGVRFFDFPGEPYDWETQWATTLRSRTVLSAFPRTMRGRLFAFGESWRARRQTAAPGARDSRTTVTRADRACRT